MLERGWLGLRSTMAVAAARLLLPVVRTERTLRLVARPRHRAPDHAAPRHDTPTHDTPTHDTPTHDTPTHDTAGPDTTNDDTSGHDTPDRDAMLRAVQQAGGRLRADCLAQSVALAALLGRAGDTPTVVLGCRRYGAGDWGAHAWVEVDGVQFDPVTQPDHAELARLSAATNWRIVPARGHPGPTSEIR